MVFHRIEAKYAAKNCMRQAQPNVMLVTLVFFLLTTIVSQAVTRLLGDPLTEMVDYLTMGYDWDEVFDYVVLRNLGNMGIFALASILLKLYSSVMNLGYTSYALRLSRGQRGSYQDLFNGFSRTDRALWREILADLFTFLWALPFLAGAAAALTAGFALMWNERRRGLAVGLMLLAVALFFAAIGAEIAASYRYRLSPYFLVDDPDCTAREAITRSKRAMKGWKMDLFTLDVSFLGWSLLTALTCGGLSVWTRPYIKVTEAYFYAAAVGYRPAPPPVEPGDVYRGPYDSCGSDGPAPF